VRDAAREAADRLHLLRLSELLLEPSERRGVAGDGGVVRHAARPMPVHEDHHGEGATVGELDLRARAALLERLEARSDSKRAAAVSAPRSAAAAMRPLPVRSKKAPSAGLAYSVLPSASTTATRSGVSSSTEAKRCAEPAGALLLGEIDDRADRTAGASRSALSLEVRARARAHPAHLAARPEQAPFHVAEAVAARIVRAGDGGPDTRSIVGMRALEERLECRGLVGGPAVDHPHLGGDRDGVGQVIVLEDPELRDRGAVPQHLEIALVEHARARRSADRQHVHEGVRSAVELHAARHATLARNGSAPAPSTWRWSVRACSLAESRVGSATVPPSSTPSSASASAFATTTRRSSSMITVAAGRLARQTRASPRSHPVIGGDGAPEPRRTSTSQIRNRDQNHPSTAAPPAVGTTRTVGLAGSSHTSSTWVTSDTTAMARPASSKSPSITKSVAPASST
jgi:hypothetical protein